MKKRENYLNNSIAAKDPQIYLSISYFESIRIDSPLSQSNTKKRIELRKRKTED